MGTVKLYEKNAYTIEFPARVKQQKQTPNGFEVALDRTAFYPTGGGQPFDTGWLNDVPVIDVIESQDVIVHILKSRLESDTVSGRVDWKRRFDHMQQHSGQHLLSACFEKIAGAGTVGFHLGSQFVYIDLNKPGLTQHHMAQAEELANKVVFDNIPIKTYFVEPEDLAGLPLRKPPAVRENIRIVEIDGFDYSPCGGTHPEYTGGIGLIKIRRWEKNRDNTRIEFVCGERALEDYRNKNQGINSISSLLSVRDFEAAAAVEKIVSDNKSLLKTIGQLKEDLCKLQADALIQKTTAVDGIKIVKLLFDSRPFEELRMLASAIASQKGCIALLCTTGEKNQIIASRAEDINTDMRKPFNSAMSQIGGRGGGNNRVVQGGFADPGNAQLALDTVHQGILEALRGR